jgi:hypothetical protein
LSRPTRSTTAMAALCALSRTWRLHGRKKVLSCFYSIFCADAARTESLLREAGGDAEGRRSRYNAVAGVVSRLPRSRDRQRMVEDVLRRARFWEKHAATPLKAEGYQPTAELLRGCSFWTKFASTMRSPPVLHHAVRNVLGIAQWCRSTGTAVGTASAT